MSVLVLIKAVIAAHTDRRCLRESDSIECIEDVTQPAVEHDDGTMVVGRVLAFGVSGGVRFREVAEEQEGLTGPHGRLEIVDNQRAGYLALAVDVAVPYVEVQSAVLPDLAGQRTHPDVLAGHPDLLDVLRTEVLVEPPENREFAGQGPCERAEGPARHVLYLGQLLERKQVDVLVRAMSLLPEATQLEIAGNDGGCGPALRELVDRLGLGSRVRFRGLLRGGERLAALAAADVVAYAGRDEVFGLVALESLLCGTPVVVANDCGCGEVVAGVGGVSPVEGVIDETEGVDTSLYNVRQGLLDIPSAPGFGMRLIWGRRYNEQGLDDGGHKLTM